MDATLTHLALTDTPSVRPSPFASVRRTIRLLGAAIVAGADHPMFATPNAASRLALTTRGDQSRLLDAGLCHNR